MCWCPTACILYRLIPTTSNICKVYIIITQGGDHSTICILIVNVHLKHCVKCSLLTEKTCKTVEGKKHTLCTAQTKYYVLFLLERICKQRQKERSRTERILTRPGKFLIAGPHAVIRASTAQIYYIPYYT